MFERMKFDFLSTPSRKLERLSGRSYESPPKGCFWSPDGTCLLTYAEDARLRLYELPKDPPFPKELEPVLAPKETECIYEADWYPKMNSIDPVSSVFVVTSRFSPIHLIDAYNGSIRATYRCYDAVDEVEAAVSVKFSADGSSIYAGLDGGNVRVFDTGTPGRETILSYGKKEMGLGKGKISSLDTNPACPFLFGAGSYNKLSGVYDSRRQSPLLLCCKGQKGSITKVAFSIDGLYFLTGSRKDGEILIWDLRKPGQLYGILNRTVTTNQRIYFHLFENYVITGGTDGSIKVFDLKSVPVVVREDPIITHVWSQESLHSESLNGVSVNPVLPLLATTAGQRHYSTFEEEGEESSSGSECSMAIWNFAFVQNSEDATL